MITLLLATTMCHALSWGNVISSRKEKQAQQELDNAKKIADSARKFTLEQLTEELQKIQDLLHDLKRNLVDYKKRKQYNQESRTQKRIGMASLIISQLELARKQKNNPPAQPKSHPNAAAATGASTAHEPA